jgi:hypothetical protein
MARAGVHNAIKARPLPVIERAYVAAGVKCCDLADWTAWYEGARMVSSGARGYPDTFCEDAEASWCQGMRLAGKCRRDVLNE